MREADAAEFDDFYLGTCHRLERQLFLLTGDLGEAEDVVAEAFERAWLRWAQVRELESAEAWVRTVARRLAVSHWRRMRNAADAWRRHGGPPHASPLDEGRVALVTALAALPDKQRLAIVLHHLADLPVEQVARETGASVAAVKQQLARGRAALAGLLDEEMPSAAAARGEDR